MKLIPAAFRRKLSASLAVMTLAILCGCDSRESWQAKTYPASGMVLINGEPAEGAVLFLEPVNGFFDRRQSRPWGVVMASGEYKLMTYKPGDGAPEGEFKLLLTWPTHGTLTQVDRLGGKFADVEHSPMNVTIVAGKNVLPPIDLKDVKVAEL